MPRKLTVQSQASTAQLDVKDLQRLIEPFIGLPVSVSRGTDEQLAITLSDIDLGALVPNFDVTMNVSAFLLNPQTVRCTIQLQGAGGIAQRALGAVGGLSLLVGQFAAHEAFTVDNAGHVDVHLGNLPGDAAEWLTNRLQLQSCDIPGKGRSAATVGFAIKRFMTLS